ncbi:hypothetical protein NR458_10545, partial [Pediococcus ethanolidurans]|nr:hypothetical protein [Pediococcus ethanolidurans]MCV3322627.1 hypothetical protein [Pediococcus ethanolidurans]MCV3324701.1 hypothetical protein [Pediococcus ethanolidurans]MCV3556124.1 hypothetical protein [Pediococcus ethanolidurans]
QKYSDTSDIKKIFNKIYLNHSNSLGMINVAVLILAYFEPNWALWCYLTLPLISFVFNRDDHSDLEEVTQLSPANQDKYLEFSNVDLRDFRKKQREIGQKYSHQRRSNPNWQTDMAEEMRKLFKDSGLDAQKINTNYTGKGRLNRDWLSKDNTRK